MTTSQVIAALEELSSGALDRDPPQDVPDAAAALRGVGSAALAARAGDVVLLLSIRAAQRLAALMMGASPDAPPPASPLTEVEIATIGTALAADLGTAPELLPADAPELEALAAGASHAVVTELWISGEPAHAVEFVGVAAPAAPAAPAESAPAPAPAPLPAKPFEALELSLRSTTVRLSAEIGRTRMPAERLVEAPAGTVIELDRDADDPIDVYVNGRRFALGRLELTPAGEWAVRIERVLDPDEV